MNFTFRLESIYQDHQSVDSYELLTKIENNSSDFVNPEDYFSSINNEIFLNILVQQLNFILQKPDSKISINLNKRHIIDRRILSIISSYGPYLARKNIRLAIELQEKSLDDISDKTLFHNLDLFKEKGIEIWLDDFGKGLSNIDICALYPFDKIKIDRTIFWELFSSNPKNIKMLITILKSMFCDKIIIEGIENESHELFRVETYCLGQGYYYK